MQQKDTDTCCLNNSTTLHSFLMSTCHLCFAPPVMSLACLFSLLLLLSANPCLSACCRHHHHRRRRLLTRLGLGRSVLCSGSPRGSGVGGVRRGVAGAASRSPRVKGENSENRAFWSAGEDLPAPFCMLEFGQGGPRGWV